MKTSLRPKFCLLFDIVKILSTHCLIVYFVKTTTSPFYFSSLASPCHGSVVLAGIKIPIHSKSPIHDRRRGTAAAQSLADRVDRQYRTIGGGGVKRTRRVNPTNGRNTLKERSPFVKVRLPIIYDIPRVWKRSGSTRCTRLVKQA